MDTSKLHQLLDCTWSSYFVSEDGLHCDDINNVATHEYLSHWTTKWRNEWM